MQAPRASPAEITGKELEGVMRTDINRYFSERNAEGLTPAEELFAIRKRRAAAVERAER